MSEDNVSQADKDVQKVMEVQSNLLGQTAALPVKGEIKPTDQVVGDRELLSIDKTSAAAGAARSKKTIDAPDDIDVPDKIISEDVDKPEEFEVAKYDAERAAPKLGTAEAAKGELSEGAKMEAAQGEVSQALLSDAAAQNAAKQFNAKTENEIQEFFTELGVQIEAANVGRRIAVDQFNSNQKVAIEQFNAQMDVAAQQFNANMRLEIDQSNAVWRRNVNTRNTAAENEAQRQNALNLLGIQQNALNNLWQRYRDKAAWTVKISETAKDRAHNAAMQAAAIAENASSYDNKYDDFLFLTAIDKIWG
jgi:hypothetical protein